MKGKKKNASPEENQKRIFLRMKSPSAFGAVKRFDSTSFMNVPPEMARRDAAYVQFAAFFRTLDPSAMPVSERRKAYARILQILSMIEEKTEFILNADAIEKRDLENVENLNFIRRLEKYFSMLDSAVGTLPLPSEKPSAETLPDAELGGKVNSALSAFETVLSALIRLLLDQAAPKLSSQREERCRNFSKSDSERYEKSFALYSEYYAGLKNC
ncbi:MAG: hypothetical protein IJS14_08590 [Lentisphaeria bacterium]|nr:hypothetical protein [Lentisphaeria bacterium]